jgi:putative transposase
MKKSRYTEEQIAYVLRQAESGTPVSDVCRSIGISEATFYVWKKKYASLGVSELRKLRQLEAENVRLKRLVADLSLTSTSSRKSSQKSSEAVTPPGECSLDSRAIADQLCSGVSARSAQPSRMVSKEHGEGSVRPAHAHPRDRNEPTAIRLPTHSRRAASRGLEGESQARASTLLARRMQVRMRVRRRKRMNLHRGPAPRPTSLGERLEHGFRARSARRRQGISRAHRGR